jgi:cytochrome c553
MRLLIFSLIALWFLPVSAGAEELSAGEIKIAKKLYVAKCAKCHKFYDPAKYSETEWRKWMDKMSRKAKLKPDQKEILSKYLETFRNGSRTNMVRVPN